MSTQKTARIAADLGGATGTLKRHIPLSYAAHIQPQQNVICALKGGEYYASDRKTKKSAPALIKTKQADEVYVEGFYYEDRDKTFTVSAGTTAVGTSITITSADVAKMNIYEVYRVNRTRDVFIVNAAPATSLTIARTTGAAAIEADDTITRLCQLAAETGSDPTFIVKDETQFGNYCSAVWKSFQGSKRNDGVKRYTGPWFETEKVRNMMELVADVDRLLIGGKASSGLGANSSSLSKGLEDYCENGLGDTYDFGGTVELSECREFGARASRYTKNMLVCLSSSEAIGVIISAFDSKLRLSPSELGEKFNLPQASKAQLGTAEIHFVAHDFYKQSGNEGRGIIFDPSQIDIYELSKMEYHEAKPFGDSNMSLLHKGVWYYDGACVLPKDYGKSIMRFEGALNWA